MYATAYHTPSYNDGIKLTTLQTITVLAKSKNNPGGGGYIQYSSKY